MAGTKIGSIPESGGITGDVRLVAVGPGDNTLAELISKANLFAGEGPGCLAIGSLSTAGGYRSSAFGFGCPGFAEKREAERVGRLFAKASRRRHSTGFRLVFRCVPLLIMPLVTPRIVAGPPAVQPEPSVEQKAASIRRLLERQHNQIIRQLDELAAALKFKNASEKAAVLAVFGAEGPAVLQYRNKLRAAADALDGKTRGDTV